jgi:hypothetical protein
MQHPSRMSLHNRLMRSVPFCTGLALSVSASAAEPNVWRACTIQSVNICSPQGCVAGSPAIWLYVASYTDKGKQHSIYIRCNISRTSCTDYRPLVHRSGAFLNFTLPKNAVVSRLGPDDMLTDVATIMDTVLISRGTCANEPPPLIRTRTAPRE